MFKKIDQSPLLIKYLRSLSTLLAKQRGLPIVIGIVLVILGFALQMINMLINSPFLDGVQIILHNVGVISALIGILLAQPLGN